MLEKIRVSLNLEWTYEQPDESQERPYSTPPKAIVPPSSEALSTLYQLVRIGNVIRLREQLRELTLSDPDLAAFEARILQLINKLRLDDIEQFLKQYMEKEPCKKPQF